MNAGDIIASYELVRLLGKGSFGEVWLVRHLDLGVERAMKIPTDPQYVRQLRQEGKLQFDLRHRNIVSTLELNLRHDPPYYVMEYVQGRDLRQVLREKGRLPAGQAVEILLQVLDALDEAHSHDVIHRDIKPENVLLCEDGTVKVTDFGLGRVQSEIAQSLMVSGSMGSGGLEISGTYDYMSPEQREGLPAEPADDLFACGVLGCELLTGQRPSLIGLVKHLQRCDVHEGLIRTLELACEAREYRYEDAADMMEDLELQLEDDLDSPAALRGRRAEETSEPVIEIAASPQLADLAKQLKPPGPADQGRPAGTAPAKPRKGATKKSGSRLAVMISLLVVLFLLMAGAIIYLAMRRPQAGPRIHTPQATAASILKTEKGAQIQFNNGVHMSLIHVPAGTFTMGSGRQELAKVHAAVAGPPGASTTQSTGWLEPAERVERETPEHLVELTRPFLIGMTEVTQEQYQSVMSSNPSRFKGPTRPVEMVSSSEVAQYCLGLSKMTGRVCRLPTEAEWEYACRAGKQGMFSFGDGYERLGDYATCKDNSGRETNPVGWRNPNLLGLYDMHGNVWEFCQDNFDMYPPAGQKRTDPLVRGVQSTPGQVIRGGSWREEWQDCRSASRHYLSGTGFMDVGFRIVMEAQD